MVVLENLMTEFFLLMSVLACMIIKYQTVILILFDTHTLLTTICNLNSQLLAA